MWSEDYIKNREIVLVQVGWQDTYTCIYCRNIVEYAVIFYSFYL